MMCTIGGLLDAEQDLRLLHLSLHETKTHSFLTHTSFHTLPPTTTTTSPPKHILYVPHLHFPWATTLCDILYRTLRLRLHPIHTTPPYTIPKHYSTFYPPLPQQQHSANCRTLTTLHSTHPGILPRISIFVKLAYCNTLLHSLNRLLNATASCLTRTRPPAPHPPTRAIRTAPRPGAAESGRVVPTLIPERRSTPPPPPHPRPSTVVRISAHALPNHRTAPHAYLLHGVSVPAPLLPTTITLLRAYGVLVELPTTEPPATLANLSNRGIGLRTDCRLALGRGPRVVDDPVQKFLLRTYAIPWPTLCAAVVRRARSLVETQRITQLSQELEELERAVEECQKVRKALVKDAVAREVAGSSLVNMCAFVIAQTDNGQFEAEFASFARDCVTQVGEARHRLWQLTTEETRSAAVLVAGMRSGR